MHLACPQHDLPTGKRSRPLELVGGEHHGPSLSGGGYEQIVEHFATVGIEPGVWLVQQQESGLPCDPDRERQATTLPGGQPTMGRIGLAREPETLEHLVDRAFGCAGGTGREPEVLADGQVVVAAGCVTHEREVPTVRATVSNQVVAEDLGVARVHRNEAGEHPQERGLARPVATREEDHLTLADVEIHAGQRGKPSEEAHDGAEADDGLHCASFVVPLARRPDAARPLPGVLGGSLGEVLRSVRRPPALERTRTRRRPAVPEPLHFARRIWRVRRVGGAIGRTFITLGILILLFVAYQLWGTSIYTAQQQAQLEEQFQEAVRSEGPPTTIAPAPLTPPEGEAVAQIRIAKIGVDSIVVSGVTREALRKGPGHYPDTPLPGQEGNAAIAGHRTTYGAPFADLDQLAPGDLIEVRTLQGSFRYRMTEQLIVAPSDVSVIEPVLKIPGDPSSGNDSTLTLTTCNPKYSAAQRLVIKAELEPDQVPYEAPDLDNVPGLTEEGLSGEASSKVPTILAGVIVLLIGALWWLFFHRHPRWTNWLIGAVPFGIALFVFFSYLERLLPSNY